MKKDSKSLKGQMLALTGIVWAACYIIALIILKAFKPDEMWGILIALCPIIAFSFFIWKLSGSIRQMDELEIRIYLEAGVIAFCFSATLIMTLGLLDLTIQLNKEDWGYRHLVPIFFMFYFAGLFYTRKKYGGHEE